MVQSPPRDVFIHSTPPVDLPRASRAYLGDYDWPRKEERYQTAEPVVMLK
jgi:hypothetical protein